MKILLVTTDTHLNGGVERHLLTLAIALHQQNINVVVCCGASWGPLCEALTKEGIKVYTLNQQNHHSLSTLSQFRKVLLNEKPDLIHGHLMPFGIMIAIRLFAKRIPIIITRHFAFNPTEQITLRRRIYEFIENCLTRKTKSLCYVSHGAKKSDPKAPQWAKVIYNHLSLSPLPLPQKNLHDILNLSNDIPLIGTVTRIVKVKNPLATTRVICNVLAQHPTAHGVIIGNGEDYLIQTIKNEINSFNLNDRFHLMDARDDAPLLMQDLSCYVMTSHSEGLPTALLNALHANIPVAFMNGDGGLQDLADLNQIIPFGKCVPQGDEKTLTKAIIHILNHPEEKHLYCINSPKVLREHFDIKVTLPQLISLYEQSIKNIRVKASK